MLLKHESYYYEQAYDMCLEFSGKCLNIQQSQVRRLVNAVKQTNSPGHAAQISKTTGQVVHGLAKTIWSNKNVEALGTAPRQVGRSMLDQAPAASSHCVQ